MSTVLPIIGWGPVQLGVSASTLFTAPTGSSSARYVINRAVFTNVTATACTITVYVVRSGGAANAGTTVISAYNVQPGEAYVAPELASLVLSAGDTIQALAQTATTITTVGSGLSV